MFGDPTRCRPAHQLAIVHENELGALRRQTGAALPVECRPAAHVALCAREQQQRIRLPHTQVAPPAGFGFRHIHDVVVGSLQPMEPMAGMSRRAHAPHQLGSPARRQRLCEFRREPANVHFKTLRNEGERACSKERPRSARL